MKGKVVETNHDYKSIRGMVKKILFMCISCLIFLCCTGRRVDSVSLYVPEHGFGVNLPGAIDTGTDTVRTEKEIIVKYIWKSVLKTEDHKNVFYNINSTLYPSYIIHSDSLGLVQLLFNDHEPAYFMNKQYELLERKDISRFGYPGANFIWLNKEDNSRICNYYYMIENRLYYLSILLPVWDNNSIRLKDRFIDSFELIKES